MNNNHVTLKNILKYYDLKAKKKFGQNFLHDKNIINQIVKSSFCDNHYIVEVGPGPGLLTNAILKKKMLRRFWLLKRTKPFFPY